MMGLSSMRGRQSLVQSKFTLLALKLELLRDGTLNLSVLHETAEFNTRGRVGDEKWCMRKKTDWPEFSEITYCLALLSYIKMKKPDDNHN